MNITCNFPFLNVHLTPFCWIYYLVVAFTIILFHRRNPMARFNLPAACLHVPMRPLKTTAADDWPSKNEEHRNGLSPWCITEQRNYIYIKIYICPCNSLVWWWVTPSLWFEWVTSIRACLTEWIESLLWLDVCWASALLHWPYESLQVASATFCLCFCKMLFTAHIPTVSPAFKYVYERVLRHCVCGVPPASLRQSKLSGRKQNNNSISLHSPFLHSTISLFSFFFHRPRCLWYSVGSSHLTRGNLVFASHTNFL